MNKCLSLLCGHHERCGSDSLVSLLPKDVVQDIIRLYLKSRVDCHVTKKGDKFRLIVRKDNQPRYAFRWTKYGYRNPNSWAYKNGWSYADYTSLNIIDYKRSNKPRFFHGRKIEFPEIKIERSDSSRPIRMTLISEGCGFVIDVMDRHMMKYFVLASEQAKQHKTLLFCLPQYDLKC
jgi:hypothetical protein